MNQQASNFARGSSGKTKQKFVPLYTQDGQREVLLPGRHECSCQASRHSLINNCLNCGRIVCQQEGSGPCFTCKQLVCTKEEQEVINRKSKSSARLLQRLMGDETAVPQIGVSVDEKAKSGLVAAIEHKNKLLEYDKTVSRRTKVIDDQSDYFGMDTKWLTKEQREKLNKQQEVLKAQHDSRRNQKLSFDFAGRQITEEKLDLSFNIEELLNSEEFLKPDTNMFDYKNIVPYEDLNGIAFNPEYMGGDLPVQPPRKHLGDLLGVKLNLMRIQDKELQEMSDEGMCLSLHQPYASLIVAGIKKHEGRIWYTCYRGRLWIHAASKVPTREEIVEAENAYRHIEGGCTFPENYPSGCLLGCIDLVDCLPQEEYRDKYPSGESASPYVFILENPQELMIKFPMKGRHKIFKMDGKFHQAAKKTLKK